MVSTETTKKSLVVFWNFGKFSGFFPKWFVFSKWFGRRPAAADRKKFSGFLAAAGRRPIFLSGLGSLRVTLKGPKAALRKISDS